MKRSFQRHSADVFSENQNWGWGPGGPGCASTTTNRWLYRRFANACCTKWNKMVKQMFRCALIWVVLTLSKPSKVNAVPGMADGRLEDLTAAVNPVSTDSDSLLSMVWHGCQANERSPRRGEGEKRSPAVWAMQASVVHNCLCQDLRSVKFASHGIVPFKCLGAFAKIPDLFPPR